MAGGAAVWCWYDVRAGCYCPLLYSYVGRGGVRSPTGAASSARRGAWAGRGLSSGGRRARSPTGAASSARRGLSGAICPAWRWCCCPLLYSYVGRGGVRSPTGAASSARRGAWAGRGLSSGGGRDLLPAAGPGCDPRKSRPRKTPHGKRQQKKR